MKKIISSKATFRRTVLLMFLVLSFVFVTDFGLFLSDKLFAASIFLATTFLCVKLFFHSLSITIYIVFYFLLTVILMLVNLLFGSGFNFLLFMPALACLFFIFLKESSKAGAVIEFDYFVKILAVTFIAIAVFELFVKLTGADFLGYEQFLLQVGDRRLDVLRVRTLFGSPLSTAALCIFFFIYFSFFKKSYFFLTLSTMLSLLSGSRTAIVLLMLMVAFSVFVSVYNNHLKITALCYFILAIFASMAAAFLSPVGAIILRSLTIELDSSFTSRSNTTIQTFYSLFDGLPGTLFVGLDGKWVSDSAIASIMAGSGMLAFLSFISLFIFLLLKTQISNFYKITVMMTFILGAMMIGDFFVPAVSLLYFMTFMIYSKREFADQRVMNYAKPVRLQAEAGA